MDPHRGVLGTASDPAPPPYFNYDTFHQDTVWRDDPRLPVSAAGRVISRLFSFVVFCWFVYVAHGLFAPPPLNSRRGLSGRIHLGAFETLATGLGFILRYHHRPRGRGTRREEK
ncbi:hypothetical protein F5X98DRAFT_329828 [Xylaria grammica]|nr:hypothetical protein F5X98DRAFT_329828 [Xylaria grammica]